MELVFDGTWPSNGSISNHPKVDAGFSFVAIAIPELAHGPIIGASRTKYLMSFVAIANLELAQGPLKGASRIKPLKVGAGLSFVAKANQELITITVIVSCFGDNKFERASKCQVLFLSCKNEQH